MRKFSSVVGSLVIGLSVAPLVAQAHSRGANRAEVRRFNGDVQPVYRLNNGRDYLMTVNRQEGLSAGYRLEGVAFQVYTTPGQNKMTLFRCLTFGGDRFLSTEANCEGQRQEQLLGYIGTSQSAETPQVLVRCNNGSNHLATVDQNECLQNAYRIEGVLGYVR